MWEKIKILVAGASLGLILVSGCTQYANQEDLNRLDEQRKAALAVEQQLQECQQKKADAERQVAEKQAVVQKLQRDLDAVKE